MNTPTEPGYYWALVQYIGRSQEWTILLVETPPEQEYFDSFGDDRPTTSDEIFEWGERIDREEMQKKTEVMNNMLADLIFMRQEIDRLQKQLEERQPLDTQP